MVRGSKYRPALRLLARVGQRVTCVCVADPVGSSAPQLPPRDTVSKEITHQGQSFTLTCHAQAFPLPVYRYTTLI